MSWLPSLATVLTWVFVWIALSLIVAAIWALVGLSWHRERKG
jgi:hypothetical protein